MAGSVSAGTLLGRHPFAGSQVQVYVGFVALLLNLIVDMGRPARSPSGAGRPSSPDHGIDALSRRVGRTYSEMGKVYRSSDPDVAGSGLSAPAR